MKMYGISEDMFLGFSDSKRRGLNEYCQAIIKYLTLYIVKFEDFFPVVSSIVFDGVNISIGNRTGLWTCLQEMNWSLG